MQCLVPVVQHLIIMNANPRKKKKLFVKASEKCPIQRNPPPKSTDINIVEFNRVKSNHARSKKLYSYK